MRIRISRRHRPMEFDRFSSYCYRVFFSFSSFEILFFSFSSLLFFFFAFSTTSFYFFTIRPSPGASPEKEREKETIYDSSGGIIYDSIRINRAESWFTTVRYSSAAHYANEVAGVCVCVCVSGSFAYDGNRSVLCFVWFFLFCFFLFFFVSFFLRFFSLPTLPNRRIDSSFQKKKKKSSRFFSFSVSLSVST